MSSGRCRRCQRYARLFINPLAFAGNVKLYCQACIEHDKQIAAMLQSTLLGVKS